MPAISRGRLRALAEPLVKKIKADLLQLHSLQSDNITSNGQESIIKMKLGQMPWTKLRELALKCGIRGRSKEKAEFINDIIRTSSRLDDIIHYGNSFVSSIDVGVKNLAWTRGNIRNRLIENCQLFSLSTSNQMGGSDENVVTANILERNAPFEFASRVHEFTRQFTTANSLEYVLIEQQTMQLHNPRSTIVESQLHAFLYPRTIPISPLTVSRYIGHGTSISKQVVQAERLDHNTEGSENPDKSSRNLKKRLGVEMVRQLMEEPEDALIFSDQAVDTFKSAKKQDDLADSMIQFITFTVWMHQLKMEMNKLATVTR